MRITSLYPVSFEKSMCQKCSALDDAEIKQKKKHGRLTTHKHPWFPHGSTKASIPKFGTSFCRAGCTSKGAVASHGHGKFFQWPSRVSLVSRVSRPHPLLRPLWSSHPVVTWPGGEIGFTKNLTSLTSSVRLKRHRKACFEVSISRRKDIWKVTPGWLTIVYSIHQIGHPWKFKLEQLPLA